MRIYSIYLADGKFKCSLCDVSGERMIELDNLFSPEVDYLYMLGQYGVQLGPLEVGYYRAHFTCWVHFLKNSADDYCLVYEHGATIPRDLDPIADALSTLTTEWHIFFPLNNFDEPGFTRNVPLSAGSYGYFLGCPVYFLSRIGADLLRSIKSIRLPLDEEIIQLLNTNEINVYADTIEGFAFDFIQSPCFAERRNSLFVKAIAHPAWSSQDKRTACDLIRRVVTCAKIEGVNLVLTGGTLLGKVRHNSIMPWDDDIDFGILNTEVPSLLNACTYDSNLKVQAMKWDYKGNVTTYYKIWFEKGTEIPGYSYKFPFIDIWLYYEEGEECVYKEGFHYPKKIFYPLTDVEFEGSILKMPFRAVSCLDIQYCDWRTSIRIFAWCHRLEAPLFDKVVIPIEVDDSGLMKPFAI